MSIIENIGSSGLMSAVKSTWYPAILISAISVVLIYQKVNLAPYFWIILPAILPPKSHDLANDSLFRK